MPFYCDERSTGIRIVLGQNKSSPYSSEYVSGFFEPCAVHLPASPSPRHEGLLGQTPSRLLTKSASGVLAALGGSTYRREYASPRRLLRPCWTAFLNSLRWLLNESVRIQALHFCHVQEFANSLLGSFTIDYDGDLIRSRFHQLTHPFQIATLWHGLAGFRQTGHNYHRSCAGEFSRRHGAR
jgi:hypothetical protein